jgi:hypothetical protein
MRQALLVVTAAAVFTGVMGIVAYSYAAEARAADDGEAVAADQSVPSCRSHECGDCAGTCRGEDCPCDGSADCGMRLEDACPGHVNGGCRRGRRHAVTAGEEASR